MLSAAGASPGAAEPLALADTFFGKVESAGRRVPPADHSDPVPTERPRLLADRDGRLDGGLDAADLEVWFMMLAEGCSEDACKPIALVLSKGRTAR
jgi:hypothetical protein